MSGAVNTAFVLDMQRKLHRWSTEKADKVFEDLFNIVCDRRTLDEAWRRLTRNRGSQTPGSDGVTRRKIEERPGGAATFLEEVREELRNGIYRPQSVLSKTFGLKATHPLMIAGIIGAIVDIGKRWIEF